MVNYKKEYWNKSNTNGVLISRIPNYGGGFNYLLTYIKLGRYSMYVIDDNYIQKEAIFSERTAILQAKKLIGITV